ncbi:MAG TPA: MacB family efflux pump subunit [Candidatus Acidoferrum sp.]|nr:MacB family efflux pump subunit [Candidatus Acidoferrum sp.]
MEAIPLIELRDIRRTFITGGGVVVNALRGINLKIYPGEFVAIMGQSGSGKSTMMNILGCLDRPTSGTYMFGGRDINSFDNDDLAWLRREAFGFVFQSYNLLGGATATENVEIPAIYAGKTSSERHIRAEALLTSLGLGDRMDHRPMQLSGGQQQRVSIARALMNGGKIILADEPTGALDTNSGKEVLELLKKLAREGHTVIIITHDPKVAQNADRVIEFRDGQVINDSGTIAGAIDPKTNDKLRDLFLSRSDNASLASVMEATKMAMRALRHNVLRTVLTLLGIVIGIVMVVLILAIGEGSQQQIVDRISSIGTNMMNLNPARDDAMRRNLPSTLTYEDAVAIADGVPNVLGTLPELQGSYTVRYQKQDYSTTVSAIGHDLPELRNWKLASGVFYNEEDNDKYTAVAVVGQTVLDKLFPNGENPLGEYILVKNIPFQVIGVLTKKGASANGQDQDDIVYIPYKTGSLRLMGQKYARSIYVYAKDVSKIDQTETNLIEFMVARHGSQDFRIFNASEMLDTLQSTTQTLTLLLSFIAAISLLVGGIGVMNIMLVSVTERTREIGIRMATGARQFDILSQFLSEAIVVTGVGGVLGVSLGVGIGIIVRQFGQAVHFSVEPVLLSFTCATATGLIFGFAPARKASRLDPVVALANE